MLPMDILPGTLYVVATPIGHLDDITLRALHVLRSVSLIAAEDTRHSAVLLSRHGITTRTTPLHEHNERKASQTLIQKMQSGASVALISDAGTPAISDPGSGLVRAAWLAGCPVVPIPGPSAVTALLSVSPLLEGPFHFQGFLPSKNTARRNALDHLKTLDCPLVFYEAPHRIVDCLRDLGEALGMDRQMTLGKELTKLFETLKQGNVKDVLIWLQADITHQKGEFVLVVEGAGEPERDTGEQDRLLEILLDKLSVSDAVQVACKLTGASRKTLYARALALKTEVSP